MEAALEPFEIRSRPEQPVDPKCLRIRDPVGEEGHGLCQFRHRVQGSPILGFY